MAQESATELRERYQARLREVTTSINRDQTGTGDLIVVLTETILDTLVALEAMEQRVQKLEATAPGAVGAGTHGLH